MALFCLMIFMTVSANLLIKTGTLASNHSHHLIDLINWKIFFGLGSFGVGGLCLIFLMQQLPLNIVQAVNTLQYVAVILAAAMILHESIPLTRWLGIFMILLGIFIIGFSQKKA